MTNLVDELATVNVVVNKDLGPKLRLATLYEVPSLLLEHRVIIGDGNQLIVTEALSICNVRKVRIASLAELANNEWLVQLHREG